MRPLISASDPCPSMIVVSSLVTTTRRAWPKSCSVAVSSCRPISSVITSPPVNTAMSRSISLRRSPKAGALTATTLNTPRSLFSTSVASASPSTSSATTSRLRRPACTIFSRSGTRSCAELIFLSWISTYASSSTASPVSALVIKYGEMYPRSNCIPSTYSTSKSRPLDSSTVITPSLPTLSITSAIRFPISLSAAEIAATLATSSRVSTERAISLIALTTASAPSSSPRFSSMALAPAATFFIPSFTMACANTVAVVVPSPATSLVLVAASFNSCAPMFS